MQLISGGNTLRADPAGLAGGLYMVRLQAGNRVDTKKLIIRKH